MKIFARITKVDLEKRQVWGRAVQEVPDKAKEIFDYETSVPHFKDWSASFEKATESLPEPSLGNIRAMHGKVAAGKVIEINFGDAEKAIDIGTEIVDDNEWEKCVKGVYTGFSIGGSYAKKWKDGSDPTLTRYTASPSEISLVDNPCVPTATFSVVKADGVTEEVPFQSYGLLKAAIDREGLTVGELLLLAKEYLPEDALAKADFGVQDIRDQLSALIAATPVAELAKSEQSATTEAAKTEPVAAAAPAAPAAEAAKSTETPAVTEVAKTDVVKALTHLRKGMYSVQTFAGILQSLAWLAQDAEAEKGWENDASTVPADLRTAIQLLCEIFKKMSAEETDEMIASIIPAGAVIEIIELAAPKGDLSKAGKRHSKADQEMVQAVHDHAVGLGADCSSEKAAPTGDIAKADTPETLEKVSSLEKTVTDLTTERDTLQKRVSWLESQPAPAKGVTRHVVSKTDDSSELGKKTPSEIKPDPNDPIAVMKAVHETGGLRITL